MQNRIINASWIILSLAMLLAWTPITTYYHDHRVTCYTESIPYSTTTSDDATLPLDTNKVLVPGLDGTREICKRGNGTQYSSRVTIAPRAEMDLHGTYVAPSYDFNFGPPPPAPISGCAVTPCSDGTCSFSTGRGTCSHHGGEAY